MTETNDRMDRFTNEVAELKLRTGRSGIERWFGVAGLVLMAGGIVVAVIAYAASLNVTATPGSNVDVLNSGSYEILAIVGLAVSLVGGFVFLRYSLARFLRFWLLRLSYERSGGAPGSGARPADAQPAADSDSMS